MQILSIADALQSSNGGRCKCYLYGCLCIRKHVINYESEYVHSCTVSFHVPRFGVPHCLQETTWVYTYIHIYGGTASVCKCVCVCVCAYVCVCVCACVCMGWFLGTHTQIISGNWGIDSKWGWPQIANRLLINLGGSIHVHAIGCPLALLESSIFSSVEYICCVLFFFFYTFWVGLLHFFLGTLYEYTP